MCSRGGLRRRDGIPGSVQLLIRCDNIEFAFAERVGSGRRDVLIDVDCIDKGVIIRACLIYYRRIVSLRLGCIVEWNCDRWSSANCRE